MKRLLILLLLAAIGGCGQNDQDGHTDPDADGDHLGKTHDNPNGEAEPNSAIAAYTEAIRTNPDDAEAYFQRGDAYGMQGDYDKAIADFTEVIRLDPNYPEADSRLKFASRVKDAQAKAAAGQKATPKKSVESRATLTLEGHSGRVASVSYSPDGKRIVSGSADKTVKVWDAQTGQETLTLKGHSSDVYSVAFSPDGKRIVSGSEDKTVRVWDAESGQEMLTLKGHSDGVRSATFSPDGKRIISGGFDLTVKVWNAKAARRRSPSRDTEVLSFA